jgi:hypothetical protein
MAATLFCRRIKSFNFENEKKVETTKNNNFAKTNKFVPPSDSFIRKSFKRCKRKTHSQNFLQTPHDNLLIIARSSYDDCKIIL